MSERTRSGFRIALFCPNLPAPPTTGGRIRTYELAREVARSGEIVLYSTARAAELGNEAARDALALYSARRIAFERLAFLPSGLPRRVRRGVPARLVRAFERDHAEHPFDVVWVEHSHGARVAMQRGLPWVLDEHNVESGYVRAKLEARGRVGLLAQRELQKLERWERECWHRATRVVCVTEADASHVAKTRGNSPDVIPNGVDVDGIPLCLPSARAGKTVLFVGLMNHPPNEQAATLLAREVMPRVWHEEPDARLVLCGANPSRAVLGLAAPRIEVTGTVPSVKPYLASACVFANPLRHGAGSSLKVLEALASGVPLVSTEVGVRGFPLHSGDHYLAAETPSELARALLVCLRGDPGADERAHAARAVAEQFRWSDLARRFAAVLAEALP
jgi:glycosyltransferase involved in cell wall biosynthesis